jgi:hypothetical protein
MQTIADRLPDAKIYDQVYADSVLGMLLAEAYTNVLVFARAATMYFQGPALRELHAVLASLITGLILPQGER